MHQDLEAGGKCWGLHWHSQQQNYFKPWAYRIWSAHSLEVNNFVVSSFFLPSNWILFLLLLLLFLSGSVNQFCTRAAVLSWLFQKGRQRALGPSCCPQAVLLYSHCLNDVQLFTVGAISDMVMLLLSSLLCRLTCFLRVLSLELYRCSVPSSRLIAAAEG